MIDFMYTPQIEPLYRMPAPTLTTDCFLADYMQEQCAQQEHFQRMLDARRGADREHVRMLLRNRAKYNRGCFNELRGYGQ